MTINGIEYLYRKYKKKVNFIKQLPMAELSQKELDDFWKHFTKISGYDEDWKKEIESRLNYSGEEWSSRYLARKTFNFTDQKITRMASDGLVRFNDSGLVNMYDVGRAKLILNYWEGLDAAELKGVTSIKGIKKLWFADLEKKNKSLTSYQIELMWAMVRDFTKGTYVLVPKDIPLEDQIEYLKKN